MITITTTIAITLTVTKAITTIITIIMIASLNKPIIEYNNE